MMWTMKKASMKLKKLKWNPKPIPMRKQVSCQRARPNDSTLKWSSIIINQLSSNSQDQLKVQTTTTTTVNEGPNVIQCLDLDHQASKQKYNSRKQTKNENQKVHKFTPKKPNPIHSNFHTRTRPPFVDWTNTPTLPPIIITFKHTHTFPCLPISHPILTPIMVQSSSSSSSSFLLLQRFVLSFWILILIVFIFNDLYYIKGTDIYTSFSRIFDQRDSSTNSNLKPFFENLSFSSNLHRVCVSRVDSCHQVLFASSKTKVYLSRIVFKLKESVKPRKKFLI